LRFPDFLRTAVLLFAGAATALAIVSVVGARGRDDATMLEIAVGWWAIAALAGLWLGRRREVAEGFGRLLADARTQSSLPELRPGTVVINRLWMLGAFTLMTGAVAFVQPQIPAIACGFLIAVGLTWRNQSRAVEAIEGRDGVRYYVEPSSLLKPIKLVRTPGFRRVEPT
jgi:hypothetical protein